MGDTELEKRKVLDARTALFSFHIDQDFEQVRAFIFHNDSKRQWLNPIGGSHGLSRLEGWPCNPLIPQLWFNTF